MCIYIIKNVLGLWTDEDYTIFDWLPFSADNLVSVHYHAKIS